MASNAPFLLSKFLEGYQQGAERTQLMRLEKAKGLMAMAQQQADLADKAEDAGVRAQVWANARKAMDEAEKIMSGSDGLWKTLTKMFGGKGGKNDQQDPHELLRQFGHESGGTYKMQEMTIGATKQQPEKQPEQQPAQQSEGFAPPPGNDYSNPEWQGEQNKQAAPPVNKDGVPVERPAPSSLGGAAELPQPRAMQGTKIQVPIYQPPPPPKPPQGVKSEEQATGQGLERVLNSQGNTELRLNGAQISSDRFRKLEDQFAVMGLEQSYRTKERSAAFQQELQQLDARVKAQEVSNKRIADSYASSLGREMSDQERDNYNYIAFGARPVNRKLDIQKFTRVDQKTGKMYETYKYLDPTTGMVMNDKPGPIGDQEIPPNEIGFRIQGIMASRKVDYQTAIGLLGREIDSDQELQNRVKKLQIQGIATTNAMNKMELDTKQRYAKGELTKQEYVERAYKESKEWVRSTSPDSVTDAFAALKEHMLQYGLQWEDWTRSIGQPQQIYEDLANSYLGKTDAKPQGSTGGGRYIPR